MIFIRLSGHWPRARVSCRTETPAATNKRGVPPVRARAAEDIVVTKQGPVRGTVVDGLRVTLGIPYAAPPFDGGRFRAPMPAEPWDGVRDCTLFGPVAPQSAELPGAPVWRADQEDVLTLNIWSTADTSQPQPVLFWIHGGAYTFGSSAQPDYDGTALARAGLTVVTCNYRLGFEGFGHVPGFPGNRGLLDQIAALEWVRDNISAFGGDPDNVTVAGQSAGGGSIACLMSSARADGLFHRAIAHSVPDAFFPPELAERLAREVAAAAGVAPTAEGLLSAPPALSSRRRTGWWHGTPAIPTQVSSTTTPSSTAPSSTAGC